jgi:hypothetical protein
MNQNPDLFSPPTVPLPVRDHRLKPLFRTDIIALRLPQAVEPLDCGSTTNAHSRALLLNTHQSAVCTKPGLSDPYWLGRGVSVSEGTGRGFTCTCVA